MSQYEIRHNPNFEYHETEDGFEILIPQTKSSSWFYAPHFMTLFLVILSMLVLERTIESGSRFSLLIDITFFSLMYIHMTCLLLWLYFGKEVVRVKSDKITFQKMLKWRFKTKVFLLSEIRDLKLDLLDHEYYFWRNHSNAIIFGKRTIGFTYKFGTVRFGRGLSDKDASELIKLLKKQISYSSTLPPTR